ncbi:hypothetical protein [Streptomyces uncialis]|uniref:Uncharacterized protein n=1 Tax=Streptomyces uncialis TaxID=1048205 RepID=A0A1Q4UYW3_9ACTN|nr:hypothetical protein [Streptomyces uncialis]OKH90706.1 hypothetical protein AB852_34445 [Streptomyces uncialis]
MDSSYATGSRLDRGHHRPGPERRTEHGPRRHDLPDAGWSSDHIELHRPDGTREVGWKQFYKARWTHNARTWTAAYTTGTAKRMDKLDTALLGSNGNVRFFGGNQYVECDWDSGERIGYTREIKEVWPGLPPEMVLRLEVAFLGPDSNARFISNGSYVECDWDSGERIGNIADITDVWPGLFS